jgi:hypothetical protein
MSQVTSLRRWVGLVVSIGAMASTTACSAESGDEEVATAEQELPSCDPDSPSCLPEDYIIRTQKESFTSTLSTVNWCGGGYLTRAELEERVKKLTDYMLGGSSFPTTSGYPCVGGGSLSASDLAVMRSGMAYGGACQFDWCNFQNGICSAPAALHKMSCKNFTSQASVDAFNALPGKVEACWPGAGILVSPANSSFYASPNTSTKWRYKYTWNTGEITYSAWKWDVNFYWHPEPVQVPSGLSGPTNTQTTGIGVNTGAAYSKVVRFPQGWTLSTAHAAGTPCSPLDIPAGLYANYFINRSGNYSRCL